MLAAEFAAQVCLPDVPIYKLSPATVVHGGPGALAASFFVPAA